jgi:hypothetical protein
VFWVTVAHLSSRAYSPMRRNHLQSWLSGNNENHLPQYDVDVLTLKRICPEIYWGSRSKQHPEDCTPSAPTVNRNAWGNSHGRETLRDVARWPEHVIQRVPFLFCRAGLPSCYSWLFGTIKRKTETQSGVEALRVK